MRDGIRLFSNIYKPDAEGKFPAILIRTPYNKSNYCEYSSFPVYAAQRGYVVIIQDVIGGSRLWTTGDNRHRYTGHTMV